MLHLAKFVLYFGETGISPPRLLISNLLKGA